MSEYNPDTGLEYIYKQPYDDVPFDVPFSGLFNAGDDIATIDKVIITNYGKVAGSTDIIKGAETINGQIAQIWFSGGTNGEQYKIEVRATSVSNFKREMDVEIWVGD